MKLMVMRRVAVDKDSSATCDKLRPDRRGAVYLQVRPPCIDQGRIEVLEGCARLRANQDVVVAVERDLQTPSRLAVRAISARRAVALVQSARWCQWHVCVHMEHVRVACTWRVLAARLPVAGVAFTFASATSSNTSKSSSDGAAARR